MRAQLGRDPRPDSSTPPASGWRPVSGASCRATRPAPPTGCASSRTAQDEGYFGPGSAAWAVHGSLPTIVGGIRALLMQALHPGALAGVMQHSRYEQDALGRLAGTTQWLTVVTFGDRAAADRECARVRGMHRKVVGTYATAGRRAAYAASDPDLLRWVHIAFTDSFLATHRVWGGPIPGGEDAYVREWAKAGELVGVVDPPRSVAELQPADRRLRARCCAATRPPGAPSTSSATSPCRSRPGPPTRRCSPGPCRRCPTRTASCSGLPRLPAGAHPARRSSAILGGLSAGPRPGVAVAAGRSRAGRGARRAQRTP